MTKIQRHKLFAKLKQKESEFVNIVPKNKHAMIIFFYFLSGFFLSLDNHKSVDSRRRGRPIITLLYLFHPPHEHLDINRLITAESLPLHIASEKIYKDG